MSGNLVADEGASLFIGPRRKTLAGTLLSPGRFYSGIMSLFVFHEKKKKKPTHTRTLHTKYMCMVWFEVSDLFSLTSKSTLFTLFVVVLCHSNIISVIS